MFITGNISGQYCYFCSDCPNPFYRDASVTIDRSYTGFCAVSQL